MLIFVACVLTVGVLVFILSVRAKDLPAPVPESPFRHLDERKVAIYENLRDLQFEFRVGKLSDEDYQAAKRDLQKELAGVLAGIDKLKHELGVKTAPVAPPPKRRAFVCPHCKAEFSKALKFCGECGQPMEAA
ncbi:MAG: hypothetical protein ACRD96_06105 [Bryobacteraceae bacterium]